jgi:hypothetical protein
VAYGVGIFFSLCLSVWAWERVGRRCESLRGKDHTQSVFQHLNPSRAFLLSWYWPGCAVKEQGVVCPRQCRGRWEQNAKAFLPLFGWFHLCLHSSIQLPLLLTHASSRHCSWNSSRHRSNILLLLVLGVHIFLLLLQFFPGLNMVEIEKTSQLSWQQPKFYTS